jgi:DNA polymerase III epsilon subunit-like protein
MIVFDTETTNLTAPEAAPIDQQPCVTEFAAIKLEERYKPGAKKNAAPELVEVARFEFLCNPKVPIPLEAIKITGITNDMVADKPPFAAFVPALCDFFLGERVVIAHNLSYDIAVLYHELRRIGRVTAFPWPPSQICTVEATMNIKGFRMNLGALHAELTGKPHEGAHRAMADVEALVRVVRELRKKGMI